MARSAKYDPLEKFRFLVEFSGEGDDGSEPTSIKVGFHDAQIPKRSTTKIPYREGIDPDISGQSAGLSTMEDIVLNRGLISPKANNDELGSINGLYKWMSTIHNPKSTDEMFHRASDEIKSAGVLQYRKDVTITMLDRAGTKVRAWRLFNVWPTNFIPSSDLNSAEDGEKTMESLTLGYEDFSEVESESPSKQVSESKQFENESE